MIRQFWGLAQWIYWLMVYLVCTLNARKMAYFHNFMCSYSKLVRYSYSRAFQIELWFKGLFRKCRRLWWAVRSSTQTQFDFACKSRQTLSCRFALICVSPRSLSAHSLGFLLVSRFSLLSSLEVALWRSQCKRIWKNVRFNARCMCCISCRCVWCLWWGGSLLGLLVKLASGWCTTLNSFWQFD